MTGKPPSEIDVGGNDMPDGISDLDRTMLGFVRTWHRHPVVEDLLWYRGINLGEMVEYCLVQGTVRALMASRADDASDTHQGKTEQ